RVSEFLFFLSASLASSAPNPTVLRVAWTRRFLVLLAHLRDLVALNRFSLRFYIDVVNPRGIQAKNLCFDFWSQLLVAILFRDFVADLESSQSFDLGLRASSPDRVGAPDDAIFATREIHNLSEEVHRRLSIAAAEPARQYIPGAPYLEVDVSQIPALYDFDQFRAPRDVLGTCLGALPASPGG